MKTNIGYIPVILILAITLSSMFFISCDKDNPTEPKKKETIKVGDTIDKVREVYGDPDLSMSYYYEDNGRSISGYLFKYSNPDLTFYFDDSSPRKVIRIVGNQG